MVNILGANTKKIEGKAYGQMIIQMAEMGLILGISRQNPVT